MKRKHKKPSTSKPKSIIMHVLRGLYDLADGLADVAIDPYGAATGKRTSYYREPFNRGQLYRAITNLKSKGLIRSVGQDGKSLYALTSEATQIMKKQLVLERLKQKKADGKWRVVVFDIPESERSLRDKFRNLLRELGFRKLQASVWAHPHDIFDDLEILIPDIKRHDWIKLLLVEVIIGERSFRKLFSD